MCQASSGAALAMPLSSAAASLLQLCKHCGSLPGSSFTGPRSWRGRLPRRQRHLTPAHPLLLSLQGAFPRQQPGGSRCRWQRSPSTPASSCCFLGASVPTFIPILSFSGAALFVPTKYPCCFASRLVFRLKAFTKPQYNPFSVSRDVSLPPHC